MFVGCVPNEPKRSAASGGAPGQPVRAERRDADIARAAPAAPARAKTVPLGPKPDAPLLAARFEDTFEREELGPDYFATSAAWRIEDGRLCARGARNRPVWLQERLPVNAVIEFDAVSQSDDGDIKVEVWGDGKSAARGTSYADATSYVIIFGGWKNQYHVIARLDEHAKNRKELAVDPSGENPRASAVNRDQTYHFKIERRDGRTVRWYVDGTEVLALEDPNPLQGPGHEYVAFNDWDVAVCFDNLEITPLQTSSQL